MTDPSRRKLIEMARRFKNATLRNEVKWQASGPNAFFLTGPDSSVVIRSEDEDGLPPYLLEVLDGEAHVVDALRTPGYRDHLDGDEIPSWAQELEILYEAARRSALDVDAVLGRIMSILPRDDAP